ncbi:MAG: cytochrome c [Mesorhizobium sp.]|nr:cytochrome c [Mesorhizobium sp.]
MKLFNGSSMPKPQFLAVVSAVVVLLQMTSGPGSGAQPPSTVERRQQAMKDMAAAAKTIAAMFSGDVAYDKTGLQEAASAFVLHGSELSTLFAGHARSESEADDQRIAAERKEFDEIAAGLEELALVFYRKAARAGDVLTPDMRMGSSVPGGGSLLGARPSRTEADLSAIPAEHLFHMMLETCTTCHSKYRLRK